MRDAPLALPVPEHPAAGKGHYESRFIRANHPDLPLAFWLRHTVRIPRDPRDVATGEVWSLFFDGLRGEVVQLRRAWPLAHCQWGPRSQPWEIGTSSLTPNSSFGQIADQGRQFFWDMQWKGQAAGPAEAAMLLPKFFYTAQLPTPKTIALHPVAVFDGYLSLNGRHVDVGGWTGSDNHNWGSRHSEDYVWSQVCGLDGAPDAYFEAVCTRPRLAGLRGPGMTLLLLRLDGVEYALNGMAQALRTCSHRTRTTWTFDSLGTGGLRLCGHIEARSELTARLRYDSPCGATQTCENSKLAACYIAVSRPGQATRSLRSVHRAALETLAAGWDEALP